jgi:hypothetical protein
MTKDLQRLSFKRVMQSGDTYLLRKVLRMGSVSWFSLTRCIFPIRLMPLFVPSYRTFPLVSPIRQKIPLVYTTSSKTLMQEQI